MISVRTRPSFTAEIVCLLRGASGLDPYAAGFLSPPLRAGMRVYRVARRVGMPDLTLGMGPSVVARHRYIDAAMLDAVRAGARQVVLLGAGYDARPWRFRDELAACTVFEVDHPATAGRRRERAAHLPDVGARHIEVDFAVDDFAVRLGAAGFDSGVPAFFAWEGVSMYLPRAAVVGTLSRIGHGSAPGSRVAMDLYDVDPDAASLTERAALVTLRALGEPVVFGVAPRQAPALIRESGLAPLEVMGPTELCGEGHRGLYVALAEVRA